MGLDLDVVVAVVVAFVKIGVEIIVGSCVPKRNFLEHVVETSMCELFSR